MTSHAQRFDKLSRLLGEWQSLWRSVPFHQHTPDWATTHPALFEAAMRLDDAGLEELRDDDPYVSVVSLARHPLAEYLPLDQLAALCEVPTVSTPRSSLPASWGVHVGGRKWRQIEAFVPHVPCDPGAHLVEWCAGKGHLARALSSLHHQAVTALEWQPALCRDGKQLAARQGARVTMVEQDVMATSAADRLSASSQLVALHACGDLHVRLLALAAERGAGVTLAPCCYQRTAAAHYRPLSTMGRALVERDGLVLPRDTLALAVQETVTAPRQVRRQRRRNSAWRLAFDLLQRQSRDVDSYLPVPSLAYGRMPPTLAEFCAWAAERKGVTLPVRIDWAALEARGWQRQAEVERLEVVRQLFRRPLELWLVLDRVLMLEEAGYRVSLGTFCQRQLTPRNLLIQAVPHGEYQASTTRGAP
ncbi:Methyltransferase domain-containing protein [Franzmannia pantelleriensis]|uniref:Methyltransferase domain-containing protein n=1 Tax=Franzmannia pantelleriensis TaxID=48727 RepID=A0A1G9UHL6_9GAMM|nr:methyltransferase [Halomonas pantelleriensis]SDM59408.1 Methyltransferase domain-containing protein [Halomonas pantelleriensis]